MEYVFSRPVDAIAIGEHQASLLDIEFGGLDDGFKMNGILGLDALLRAGAVLDLKNLSIDALV